MTNLIPFELTFNVGHEKKTVPCTSFKSLRAEAKQAHQKGYTNICALSNSELGKHIYEPVQNLINAFPPKTTKTRLPGSLDASIRLSALAIIAQQLSKKAKREPLSEEDTSALLSAMEEVDDQLGLTGPHAFEEHVSNHTTDKSFNPFLPDPVSEGEDDGEGNDD